MIFKKMKLDGVFVLEIEKIKDERGFFARSWDTEIFSKMNLKSQIIQCNISFNNTKGTIRGMHFQIKPYEEGKIVRCTKGEVFEVIIDLRENSETFLQWDSIKLTQDNHKMVYVPEGCALGFQTLENNTEIFYQMTQKFFPKFAKGLRWNDPKLGIKWPLPPTVISQKDKLWPLL